MNFKILGLLLCLAQGAALIAADQKNTENPPVVQKPSSFLNEIKQVGKITALSFGGAALYGILNDQVTARVCHEYFTKGFHARMVEEWSLQGVVGHLKNTLQTTQSPTVTACIWGVVGTLGMGALTAIFLNGVSRVGERKKYTAKDLVKPCGIGMAVTGVCSALALSVTPAMQKVQCTDGTIIEKFPTNLFGIDTTGVPTEKLSAFSRCLFAHKTAYGVGALAILGAAGWVLSQRLSYSGAEKAEQAELIKKLAAVKKA